jgi:hypothetical protein
MRGIAVHLIGDAGQLNLRAARRVIEVKNSSGAAFALCWCIAAFLMSRLSHCLPKRNGMLRERYWCLFHRDVGVPA